MNMMSTAKSRDRSVGQSNLVLFLVMIGILVIALLAVSNPLSGFAGTLSEYVGDTTDESDDSLGDDIDSIDTGPSGRVETHQLFEYVDRESEDAFDNKDASIVVDAGNTSQTDFIAWSGPTGPKRVDVAITVQETGYVEFSVGSSSRGGFTKQSFLFTAPSGAEQFYFDRNGFRSGEVNEIPIVFEPDASMRVVVEQPAAGTLIWRLYRSGQKVWEDESATGATEFSQFRITMYQDPDRAIQDAAFAIEDVKVEEIQ